MSERYAGVKHLVSGRVQLSILAIFFHMVKQAVDAFDIRPPVDWKSGLLTWADLERFRSSAEEVDRLLAGLGAAVEPGFSDYPFHSADVITQLCDPSQEPARPAAARRSSHFHQPRTSVKRKAAQVAAPVKPASPVRPPSQSSSSSVSSTEVPETEGALPNYLGVSQIPWFAMNRASVVHIIQEIEEGRLIPGAAHPLSQAAWQNRAWTPLRSRCLCVQDARSACQRT